MKRALILGVVGALSICAVNGSELNRTNQKTSMVMNHNMEQRHANKDSSAERRALSQQQAAQRQQLEQKHAAERATQKK